MNLIRFLLEDQHWLLRARLSWVRCSSGPEEPHRLVPAKPLRSIDRFEGQKARLSPSASSITVRITGLTLPISLFYFIPNASLHLFPSSIHLQPFSFILSLSCLFANYNSSFSLFCFMQRLPSNLPVLNSFLLLALFFVFVSLGLSPFSFYLSVSHYIPYLSL